MKKIICIVLLLGITGISGSVFSEDSDGKSREVVPIDWSRFHKTTLEDENLRQCSEILLKSAKYNLNWIKSSFKEEDPEWRMYNVKKINEKGIRPPGSVAYALAVIFKTGIYDENIVGMPEEEAKMHTIKLLRGLAKAHGANTYARKAWGDQWQSALWAALFCHAGWMIWDELGDETRRMLRAVIEFEADRFIWRGYKVPYWNGKGGDSKAEENAWNSAVLQVAVAMMPNHPDVMEWKKICSELMVSSFSQKKDMENSTTVLDGKPVKDWLNGYNLHDEGYVINHKLIHTDYMVTIKQCMRSFITQTLGGEIVSETADFNFDVLYNTLVTKEFSSPPHKKPGGTMYIPGKAEVYYPTGTDWSRYRFDIYYLMDAYAFVFGFDADMPYKAGQWMRVRANKIIEMQSRFDDGRVYKKGEYDTYAGREQIMAWQMADSFMILWLNYQNAISTKGNWLGE